MTPENKVQDILFLKEHSDLTNCEIAEKVLGKRTKESTVRDILRRYNAHPPADVSGKKDNAVESRTEAPIAIPDVEIVKVETTRGSTPHSTHLFIGDTQVKPGVDMSYLDWVGQYIADRQPDVIIHAGDHADMPSLSSYDRGKKSAEGRRVQADIDSAIEGMNRLLAPIRELQQRQLEQYGYISYRPKMVLTLGNHEQRIMRHVEANPELEGFLSYDNLMYKEMGWEVYDYLEPVIVNGVTYCHFMPNPMSGKPYGGSATNILKNVGESFCVGHKQTLDVATRFLPASGKQQWGIICGACYLHDEAYKGYQGNKHYRGLVVKHDVKDGSFDPMFVSLAYLEKRYG